MRALIVLLLTLLSFLGVCQEYETVYQTSTLRIAKLSPRLWLHVSYLETEKWGPFPCNGLIYKRGKRAVVFDTPVSEEASQELIDYLREDAHLKIEACFINHWHVDCLGGLNTFHDNGISSYAQLISIDSCKSKGIAVPMHGFEDRLSLRFRRLQVECYYPGAAHTSGNMACYLPKENALFAGCMVKEVESRSLGNLADADISSYAASLNKLLKQFPEAELVIPGHGRPGGQELIEHSLKLAKALKED